MRSSQICLRSSTQPRSLLPRGRDLTSLSLQRMSATSGRRVNMLLTTTSIFFPISLSRETQTRCWQKKFNRHIGGCRHETFSTESTMLLVKRSSFSMKVSSSYQVFWRIIPAAFSTHFDFVLSFDTFQDIKPWVCASGPAPDPTFTSCYVKERMSKRLIKRSKISLRKRPTATSRAKISWHVTFRQLPVWQL